MIEGEKKENMMMKNLYRFCTILALALVMGTLTSSCDASSPEAWEEFRGEVKAACLALAANLKNPSIQVDPFGTQSYGVALVKAEGDAATYVCVFDKVTKAAEFSLGFEPDLKSGN